MIVNGDWRPFAPFSSSGCSAGYINLLCSDVVYLIIVHSVTLKSHSGKWRVSFTAHMLLFLAPAHTVVVFWISMSSGVSAHSQFIFFDHGGAPSVHDVPLANCVIRDVLFIQPIITFNFKPHLHKAVTSCCWLDRKQPTTNEGDKDCVQKTLALAVPSLFPGYKLYVIVHYSLFKSWECDRTLNIKICHFRYWMVWSFFVNTPAK